MPLYEHHPTDVASDAAGDAGNFNLGDEDCHGESLFYNNAGVMEKWKEEGKAALIDAGTGLLMVKKKKRRKER